MLVAAPTEPPPQLPREVVSLVMENLGENVQHLCTAAMVCRDWATSVAACDSAWRTALLRDYGEAAAGEQSMSPWSEAYV